MSKIDKIKTVVFVVLVILTCVFGSLFRSSYNRFMTEGSRDVDADKIDKTTTTVKPVKSSYSHMMYYGAIFFVSAISLGLTFGHELSRYVAERFMTVLYDDDGELAKTPEYELAEQEWANGNPLDAIQLMRNYLKDHPHEQHVSLRIAEIYEKDMKNYLAAALEYEEVLKQKLSAEQWGWSAIHLCNLYNTRLNQPEKALALLKRIDSEYGHTAAAEKARKYLGVSEEVAAITQPTAPQPAPHVKSLYPASDSIEPTTSSKSRKHQASEEAEDEPEPTVPPPPTKSQYPASDSMDKR